MNKFEYIVSLCQAHADEAKAMAMKAYMKQKFDYFGITVPKRKELFKTFKKILNLNLILIYGN